MTGVIIVERHTLGKANITPPVLPARPAAVPALRHPGILICRAGLSAGSNRGGGYAHGSR